jgi:hypothetical protein
MRTKLAAAIAALALAAVAAPAHAKGPSDGTIEGEGLSTPIEINQGEGTPGGDRLIEDLGFFQATFGQSPDPMERIAPAGDLGPKLTIRWNVPGPDGDVSVIVQDLYPYAEDGPVVYTEPDQVFFVVEHTEGGWFRAPDRLLTTLQSMGLPSAEALRSPSAPDRDTPWATIGASLGLMLVLSTGAALLSRRREKVAPAAA